MKRIRTKAGLIAYETTTSELALIGSAGICDECGELSLQGGYLVPVLNHWQCEKCFKDWSERAIRYPEDDYIEKKRAKYYETMIPVTNDFTAGDTNE